jgi:hypothetical protein
LAPVSKGFVQSALDKALDAEFSGDNYNVKDEKNRSVADKARADLEASKTRLGAAGIDVNAIARIGADEEAGNQLRQAIESFKTGTNTFAGLDAAARNLQEEFDGLSKQIKLLKDSISGGVPGQPAQPHAMGGAIFSPRGTDTVPAMLTPGEFVVPRDAAQANLGLLESIRRGHGRRMAMGGMVYLAEGGFIPVQNREAIDLLNRKKEQAEQGKQAAQFEDFKAGLEDELRYQAATNPYGGSALWLNRYNATKAVEKLQSSRKPWEERLSADGIPNGLELIGTWKPAREDAERRQRQNAASEVAERTLAPILATGLTNLAGNVTNFNRRSWLAQGINRPGQEGQRAIGAASAQQSQKLNDLAARRDFRLSDYLKNFTQVQSTPERFAGGGMVSGQGNTDSVHALLTPNEFVLKPSAVARAGAGRLQHFNDGGMVSYLAGGGEAGQATQQGNSQLVDALTAFSSSASSLGQTAQVLTQAMTVFSGNATALTQAISQMPKTLTVTGQHSVTVTFNGAEVMAKLSPEIQELVTNKVQQAMSRVFKEQMPDAGVQVS